MLPLRKYNQTFQNISDLIRLTVRPDRKDIKGNVNDTKQRNIIYIYGIK